MPHRTIQPLQPTTPRYPRRLRTELFSMLRRQVEMLVDEAANAPRLPARTLAIRRAR